jgi:hypothetical protein
MNKSDTDQIQKRMKRAAQLERSCKGIIDNSPMWENIGDRNGQRIFKHKRSGHIKWDGHTFQSMKSFKEFVGEDMVIL